MYKRDFGILLLAAFAVYFTLQDEGTFEYRKAWYHHIDEDAAVLKGSDVLPQPVVADLNGDGEPELIVATHDAKLQVLAPKPPGRKGDGFAQAKVLAEVPLAQSGAAFTGSARAAAIAAGSLDPSPKELVRPPAKQVVVVVTHGWHVLCFDHNLQLLWDRSIREGLPHHAAMSEVAIHISNHTVHKKDRGLVVVGASSHLGDLSSHTGLGSGLDDADPLEAELAIEKEEERRRKSALGELEDITKDNVDVSRHFSYYAWDGGAGSLRWKHEGQDFHRDAAQLAEQVIPQHNYRLDAAALAGRHYGQVSCRNFRTSVLRSMPHRWASRSDTRLALSHFHHHKAGRGAQKHRLGAPPERLGLAHHGKTETTRGQHGKEANKVAAAIGKLATGAVSGASGKPTSTPPVTAETAAAHFEHPNVLVAHLKEGIEAIHLYTGRTICKLHLPSPGVHADINGDGVLDHIQAHGGTRGDMPQTGHRQMPACWASVHSGLPPKQHVFNGTICRGGTAFVNSNPFATFRGNSERMLAGIEVAPPAVLPVVGARGRIRRSRAWPVFANSRGEVTAYDAIGNLQWQVNVGTSWTNAIGSEQGHALAPTLQAIPLRAGAAPVAILAAGTHTGALVSEHGHLLDHLELPAPPLLPLQVVDWNFDRYTDIILTTRQGYYGFAQVRTIGGVPFGALLVCVMVALMVVYATQQGSGSRKRKGRSTDRTD